MEVNELISLQRIGNNSDDNMTENLGYESASLRSITPLSSHLENHDSIPNLVQHQIQNVADKFQDTLNNSISVIKEFKSERDISVSEENEMIFVLLSTAEGMLQNENIIKAIENDPNFPTLQKISEEYIKKPQISSIPLIKVAKSISDKVVTFYSDGQRKPDNEEEEVRRSDQLPSPTTLYSAAQPPIPSPTTLYSAAQPPPFLRSFISLSNPFSSKKEEDEDEEDEEEVPISEKYYDKEYSTASKPTEETAGIPEQQQSFGKMETLTRIIIGFATVIMLVALTVEHPPLAKNLFTKICNGAARVFKGIKSM